MYNITAMYGDDRLKMAPLRSNSYVSSFNTFSDLQTKEIDDWKTSCVFVLTGVFSYLPTILLFSLDEESADDYLKIDVFYFVIR